MKYTLEEKLKMAKLHIDEGVPYQKISEDFNYSLTRVKYLCSLYRMHGEKPFKKNENRVTYTRELKLETIHDVLANGKSCNGKAMELMLTDPTIVKDWVRLYQEKGEDAIKDTYSREAYKHHEDKVLEKEYKKLLEDLERTKAENEYLKKSFPLALERSKRSKRK